MISDESPLAGFTVNDPNSGQYIYRDVIRNDADQTYSNGRYRYKATVNMSEIRGGGYNKPYVLAWDYGLNHSKATTVGQSAGNGGGADQPGDNGGNTGDQPGNGGNTGDRYMYTGWLNRGGRWYYLNNSGAMETGWVKVGNRWYYMGSDGSMYTGTQSIDGQSYTFDDSGVWVK